MRRWFPAGSLGQLLPSILHSYLWFVIFCTPAQFSELQIVRQKVRKFATIIVSRQNSVNQYWGLKFTLAYSFDWDCVFGVLVAYSFDWDGVLGVLVGVLFWLRWRTWCFGWRILLVEMAYLVFWLAYSFDWDGIFVALIGVLVVFV